MLKIDRWTKVGIIMACLMFFVCGSEARAQVETGRFVGRITDPQGAVIPGAAVKATNIGTNIVQTATTNSNGEFVITPVQAGIYNLTVTAKGFSVVSTSNVEVQVGQVVREDLSLHVGAETTTIDVTVETPLLSTDTATIGTVITNQQLTNLPLN